MAIGEPLRRLEDRRLLVGQGCFTDDLVPPDTCHVAFLRSPHAHARITAIDTSAARQTPDVLAVWTGADTAAAGLTHLPAVSEIFDATGERHREPPRPPIAVDRVRHVGEIVGMVVARDRHAARDAADRIEVSYETLPAVVTGEAAAAPGAPVLHESAPRNLLCHWTKGDATAVAEAFGRAARVVRLRQSFNRIVASYLETRSLLATHAVESGVTTLTGGSQGVQILHRLLAGVLGWEAASLRLVTPDVGGGFGPKFSLYPETVLVPWAARRLALPVWWSCERSESFLADNHARDLTAEIALALDEAGRFLAIRVDAIASFGAYVSMFAPTIPTTGMARVLSGLYRVPAMHIDMRCVATNTVPVDAFRGAGKPETLALLERAVDIAAQETGIDKVELRRRNFIPEAAFPYTTPLGYTYERTDYPALLDGALQLADFGGFGERRRASEARELRRGFGLACHLHPTGGIADERGCVMVRADGTIEAVAGTQSQGQGHATAFAQIVAQTLDLPIETVRLIQGDSARVPQGGGTGGSSSTIISGNTLVRAGETMLARARELAAERLEVSPVDLAYADGVFKVAGTDRRIGLSALAAEVENAGGLLEGTATFDGSLQSWPAGVMTCEVELDPETGAVSVDRLDVVVDIGTVINPLLVEGQIHGGIAAGLGQALLEDARYEPGTGQLLAGSWLDYALPRAADLPFMRVALAGTASQSNALGIKGVGELPTNGAPAAVANAVLDALQPYGIRHLSSPLTSEMVWRAIHASVGDEGR